MASPGTKRNDGPLVAPLCLDDLLKDLLWPRLLRVPLLGLNPARIVAAFLTIVLVGVLIQAGTWIDSRIKSGTTAERWRAVCASVHAPSAADQLGVNIASPGWQCCVAKPTTTWRWFVRGPGETLRKFPVTTILFGPLAVLAALIGLTAICRMAACEFAQGVRVTWPEGFGFAAARWKSLVGAAVGPIVVAWLIALGLALAGMILLRWPVLNLLGSLLFGLFLLGGLLAAVILVFYIVGHALLLPAIASDGADAFDAIQRAAAYVIGRPLRLAVYYTIAGGMVMLAAIAAMFIVGNAAAFASEGALVWSGESARTMAVHAAVGLPEDQAPAGTFAWSASLISLWLSALFLLVGAYVVSTAACGATAAYLLLRRVNDGQDIGEIWMPGMIPGTLAPVVSASQRAAAANAPDEVDGNGPPSGAGGLT